MAAIPAGAAAARFNDQQAALTIPIAPSNYRATLIAVDVSFDPAKRALTLRNRGLDFADAGLVFTGITITIDDARRDYGEERRITAGYLAGRCVVVVWTPRAGSRRIISMRHAHANEERAWFG